VSNIEREIGTIVDSIRLELRQIEALKDGIKKQQRRLEEILAELKGRGNDSSSLFEDIGKWLVGDDQGSGVSSRAAEETLKVYGSVLGGLVFTVIDNVLARRTSVDRLCSNRRS